jgi:plasmid maintenance system killer protein
MNAWGILGKPTPEKVQEWMNLPYGQFRSMVSGLNKRNKGKSLRKYTVEIQDIKSYYSSAFVYVDAVDSDQAIELARLSDMSNLEWSELKGEKQNKYSYRVSQVWD